MNHFKRYISVFLTLVVMVSLCTVNAIPTESAVYEESDFQKNSYLLEEELHDSLRLDGVQANHTRRAFECETDLYSLIYENGDGTNTMYYHSYPVKYIDDAGIIRDKTVKLEYEDNQYISADNDVISAFSNKLSDGISLNYDDINVSMTPLFYNENNIPYGAMAEDHKSLVYAVDDNLRLEYSLTMLGYKEDIILAAYDGRHTFEFMVYTNGLELIKNDLGYLRLVDDDGNVVVNIGEVIIFTADNRNNSLGDMDFDIIEDREIYKITIDVDEDYLTDENTAYPVRIDPTLEISYDNNGSGAIQDVTLNSEDTSDGASGSLFVGKRDTYGIARALMKFPYLNMSVFAKDSDIISAAVYLRDLLCESESMTVYCHPFTGNTWTESTAHWTNVSPNSYGAYESMNTVSYANGANKSPEHTYGFTITNIVKGWKNGTYTQGKGILFKASSSVENGTALSKTFCSYNRNSTFKPRVTIVYGSQSSPNTTTVSSLPYSNTRTMSAGLNYVYKYTPTASGKYSAWTTGSTDTKLYVYNNAGMTNQVGYNDDSGHGYNACITLNLTAGTTYYFAVHGYNATTTGAFTFKLQRGLPQSGSEKPSYFDIFNASPTQKNTNCYAYALNMHVNPINGEQFLSENKGLQPGNIAGQTIGTEAFQSVKNAQEMLIPAVIADVKACPGGDFLENIEENDIVPAGYYKVALFINPGTDYHWYRQVSDRNGAWTHKPGDKTARAIDESGNAIWVPTAADTGPWTDFVGYYAYKPPTTSPLSLGSGQSTMESSLSSTHRAVGFSRYDLVLRDFTGFASSTTTKAEVRASIGDPHDYYGSGYIADVYYLEDGRRMGVYYVGDVIYQIRIINADHSYVIVVE